MLTSSLTLFRNGINGYSAIATGALGVKAWYTASSNAGTASAASAITGTIGSATSTAASAGNFIVAVKSDSVDFTPSTVALSDDLGNTYVDNNGATAGGKVAASGTGVDGLDQSAGHTYVVNAAIA